MCRFNLDEQQLREIVGPWTREPSVEIEDQKWIPRKAKITVLEGPHIPPDQLTMGRGWRTAERESKNVTDRVLAAVRQEQAASAASDAAPADSTSPDSIRPDPSQQLQPDPTLVADSLGLELLAQLASGPVPLSTAWRVAGERDGERSPSEALALAERAVRSLLQARLIVLTPAPPQDTAGQARLNSEVPELGDARVAQALSALDSWAEHGGLAAVHMRRT